MRPRHSEPDEYELHSPSFFAEGDLTVDNADTERLIQPDRLGPRLVKETRLCPWSPRRSGYVPVDLADDRPIFGGSTRPKGFRRFLCSRRFYSCFRYVLGFLFVYAILHMLFAASYDSFPANYEALRKSVLEKSSPGRGNPYNEKIFIASSLYDGGGELARGQWGMQLLELIELLGDQNVFVSIYENDSGEEGHTALRELEQKITSPKSIVFEDHLDPKSLPAVTIPGGEKRVKRIEYLARVRNKALQPLDDHPDVRYDKLLYLNDILFNPMEALHLLFSTNSNETGVAQYRAACAVDFANPFKFYDTYATRDLQGYSMGLPLYPWFSSAGNGASQKDVFAQKDAVRVRSCWGGMVAFNATYFQTPPPSRTSPVRFRAGPDLFWEASECCLIHADLQDPQTNVDEITDTGIYMNPYTRVAYDSSTLYWLSVVRRLERSWWMIPAIINRLVGLPWYNPRRTEVPGQSVQETVWIADETQDGGGSFQTIGRIAGNDGFCGRRGLQVIVEDRKPGQKGWENIPVPSI